MPLSATEQRELYHRMMHDDLHRIEMDVRRAALTAVSSPFGHTVHLPFASLRRGYYEYPAVDYSTITVHVPDLGNDDARLLITETSIRRDVVDIMARRRSGRTVTMARDHDAYGASAAVTAARPGTYTSTYTLSGTRVPWGSST